MSGQRILLIAINYWPELIGIGKYTGEMAEWLTNHDFKVRMITALPYYPSWRVHGKYTACSYKHGSCGSVDVWRCPLYVPSQPTGFKRIIHLASFALSSFPVILLSALRWRPEIIFMVEPPFFCAPGVLFSSWLAGARSWLHVQDFEVDAAFNLGILRSEYGRKWVRSVENWLMQRFDRVTAISDKMLRRLAERKLDKSRCGVFPNWVDLDQIRPRNNASYLRKEWGIGADETVLLYSGNMGEKQGLEIIFDVAKLLQHEASFHFVLCGDGATRRRLERMAKGIQNIIFTDLQPVDRLNDLLNAADIHILPQRADVEDLVLPSKLINMMASGRPVVATAHSGTQVAEIAKDCGIVVSPGDVGGVAAAIKSLAVNPELREKLGNKARLIAERLWDKNKILSTAFGHGAQLQ